MERPNLFVATPDRVSQYLEIKAEEVTDQMKSVKGREQLFDKLMVHADDIKKDHADFHPEVLKSQLESAGEALLAKERFVKDIRSPEKKGMFRRAWDSVKGFAKKHPVVTTVAVLTLAAGGVAAGFYLTGNWELLLASTGLKSLLGRVREWGGAAKDAIGGAAEKVTGGAKDLAGKVIDKIPENIPKPPVAPDDVIPPLDEAKDILKQWE